MTPTCRHPDRDCAKMMCGYPLPCPWHTSIIDVTADPPTVTIPVTSQAMTLPTREVLGEVARALASKRRPKRKPRGYAIPDVLPVAVGFAIAALLAYATADLEDERDAVAAQLAHVARLAELDAASLAACDLQRAEVRAERDACRDVLRGCTADLRLMLTPTLEEE